MVRLLVTNFVPRLDILPAAQRQLWTELNDVPPEFVLYGGTAIALHLGHREIMRCALPFRCRSITRPTLTFSAARLLIRPNSSRNCHLWQTLKLPSADPIPLLAASIATA